MQRPLLLFLAYTAVGSLSYSFNYDVSVTGRNASIFSTLPSDEENNCLLRNIKTIGAELQLPYLINITALYHTKFTTYQPTRNTEPFLISGEVTCKKILLQLNPIDNIRLRFYLKGGGWVSGGKEKHRHEFLFVSKNIGFMGGCGFQANPYPKVIIDGSLNGLLSYIGEDCRTWYSRLAIGCHF